MTTTGVIVAVLCLVLGLTAGFAGGLERGRGKGLPGEAEAALRLGAAEVRAAALEQENTQLRNLTARDQEMLRVLGPLQTKLQEVQTHVAVLEKERASQYAALTEQLRSVQATDTALRTSTEALAASLRSSSARGTWGEVELRRVLELSGLGRHIDFYEQRSFFRDDAAQLRPDVTVALPGGKYVAIDAKAPMEAFLQAGALDGSNQEAALVGHARALRGHIDALTKRNYPAALGSSPDFTVLFLPMESLLSSALEADPSLLEYALGRGITPATPASLLALLKTVAVVWRHATVTEEAHELLELGQALYDRLGVLGDHVAKVGSALAGTVARYNQMVGSLESRVLVAARSFEGFDASKLTATPIPPDKAQVRSLTAPELASN
jgi:DNA recombination protein RmuC